MKKIFVIGLTLISLLCCENENRNNTDILDSIELTYGDCFSTIEHSIVCFDTVISDSRCAQGAICKWEGNAIINLNLTLKNGNNHEIELNTNSDYQIDTTIDCLYILLTDLTPYPDLITQINPNDYKAKLTIANIDKLESNARLLNFNPDKCYCCWGWTIKIGNDTIKSDNAIIGETMGYIIDYPVNVYVELGDLKRNCSDISQYAYYDIKQIIKTK